MWNTIYFKNIDSSANQKSPFNTVIIYSSCGSWFDKAQCYIEMYWDDWIKKKQQQTKNKISLELEYATRC